MGTRFAHCTVLLCRHMSLTHLPNYYSEERPWGGFERLVRNERATVKILRIDADKRFSLQTHSKREEFWRVIEGSGTLQIGEEAIAAVVGTEVRIPIGTVHRATGGPAGMKILEVTTGEHDEADITRIEDDFGRS